MLKLAWLGSPIAEIDAAQVHFETRKVTALLAYLSLNTKPIPREKLATLFWPEADQSHSLANLRRGLGSLLHSLPEGYVQADRETIGFTRIKPVEIDVFEFQSTLQNVRNHQHAEVHSCSSCLNILEASMPAYRGEFLEGMNLPDCSAFDDWQYDVREEMKRDFAWMLEQLTLGWSGRAAWDKAFRAARRWVSLDRLGVDAQLALVDLYIHSGQRSLAQSQFEEYAQLAKAEFGQELDRETLNSFRSHLNPPQSVTMEARPTRTTTTQGLLKILKSKLYLPSLKTNRITRTRLLSLLDEIANYKLTLVSAPAGFGKTMLLADWVIQSKQLVSWLSLDKGDNDVVSFYTYICAAIESLIEGACANTLALLEDLQPSEPRSYMMMLLKDLERITQPIVLILDDYQFITSRSIHEDCTYLLERATKNLHLVIASRADPPLPLARLRAQEELLEIRIDDLRFTLSECETFIHKVMLIDLSADEIQTLAERTEGWAVGLQMAALSMRDRKDVSSFIKSFSGTNRYILDYLLEEVLASQPPEIQRFLLYTSVVESLTAPLCDALLADGEGTKREGEVRSPFEGKSVSILEYLERVNLFLVPVDEERIWYRYHHLFADLLYARLQQILNFQDIAELHTRAGQWYQQNGLTYEAINHASLTSNNAWVEQLIEQNYMEMFHRGEASSMRSWTGKLSKELIYRRPWLCIYEAQSYALFGQLDEADVLIAAAEKHLQSENAAGDTKSMRGHLAYVKSRVTGMRGDVPLAIELSLAARENTPPSNQALQSGIGVMLGVGYFLSGDFTNAVQVFNETICSGKAAHAINGTVAAYCHLARIHAIQGELHKSYELYQEAGIFANEMGGRNRGVMSLVDIGIANTLYELNDLEHALVNINHGLELIHLWGNADDIVLAYTIHARIQQAQENKASAAEAIEKGFHLIQTRGVFSFTRDALSTARAKLWLAQGDLQSAARWAASQEERSVADRGFGFENELIQITLSRVYIAQQKPDEAISLLTRLEQSAESAGRTGRLIEILVLKALTLQMSDDADQALVALGKGLLLAEPEGYIRVFIDEGELMKNLLYDFYINIHQRQLMDIFPGLETYVEKLLASFGPISTKKIPYSEHQLSPHNHLIEPLSSRELEVLQLICEGDSNQMIADKLVITVKTVKKHTGNILGKLGVTSRAQAMVKARQLDLIPRDN